MASGMGLGTAEAAPRPQIPGMAAVQNVARQANGYRPGEGTGYYGPGNFSPMNGGYNTPNGMNGGARSGTTNLLGLYNSMYAPDQANLGTQGRLMRNQMGLLTNRMDANMGDMRSQYGFDMRGLGLDRQGLGISRGAATRGIRNTRREEEIARGLYGNSQTQANLDAGEQVRQQRSSATASGAMSAPGIRNDLTNTYGNLSLLHQRNNLGFQRDLLGIREERNSYRDQIRNLDLESQRLGIRSDELRMGLRSGLRNLRLDTSMSVNDLLGSLSSNNQQRAALARQILDQAMAAARGGG